MAYNKKKIKKTLRAGVVHINSTFNNTIISITDQNGETACWESAGSIGYKGSKKSTPFAAQIAMERAGEKAVKLGLKEVEVRVKGPGSGRESAIRALINSGIIVKAITDVTPLPHNGCRPRKKRRAGFKLGARPQQRASGAAPEVIFLFSLTSASLINGDPHAYSLARL
jgi:small subunit ribosomal protein S11